jgi:DNA-binding NarL/FixJ family response regulator
MKKITVLLADDHMVVRQGIKALIQAENDIEVVGEAETGRQAVELVEKLKPEVVVMDIAMPFLNGLEATRQILKKGANVKILVLSSYSDDDYVRELMEAGASGYLIKQTAANELLKAIREAHRGNAYFSPIIAKRLRDQCREGYGRGETTKKVGASLTSRELEVLQLIAEGHANKQIAAELCISIKTVEKHRQQAMDKLNIHDIAGLTRYAINKGIIDPNTEGRMLRQRLGLSYQTPTATSPTEPQKQLNFDQQGVAETPIQTAAPVSEPNSLETVKTPRIIGSRVNPKNQSKIKTLAQRLSFSRK